VAIYARYGGTHNNHFTANFLENLPVKEFWRLVKIWQNYGHEFGVQFFGPPCNSRQRWAMTVQQLLQRQTHRNSSHPIYGQQTYTAANLKPYRICRLVQTQSPECDLLYSTTQTGSDWLSDLFRLSWITTTNDKTESRACVVTSWRVREAFTTTSRN